MAIGSFGGRANSSSQDGQQRRLARRHREQSRRRRLLLESLEDRSLLAILTWVGDQGANWNTDNAGDTNWSGDALPIDGDTLIFAGAAPGALNNDTTAGNSYTLQFSATGFTIAGNGITLGNAGTDISDAVGGNAVNTPLTVATSAVDAAAGIHSLGGSIGGAGGLSKVGAGQLVLSNANTYAGGTTVSAGTLRVDGSLSSSTTDTVSIASGATLSGSGDVNRPILGSAGSVIAPTGNMLLGNNGTSSGFATDGTLTVGANSVTLRDSNVAVLGPSTTLAGGSLTAANGFSLSAGDVLSGNGTLNGNVTTNTGTINPGTSPGLITINGNLNLANGTYPAEINGAVTPGTDYDQLDVNGTVNVTNATLTLSGTFVPNPAVLQSIVIIDNDGTADAVTGRFAGLPEGAPIAFGGGTLYITYGGGDGNDVVLNSQPIANGTAGADTFLLTGNGINFTLTVNGTPVNYTSPPHITINGQGGNDALVVDYSAGQAAPAGGVFYHGNGQTSSPGDILSVVGTGTQTATYTPNGVVNPALDNDGTVVVDGGTINFTGLEPINITSMLVANVALPGANDVLSIDNGVTFGAGPVAAIRVTGSSGGVGIETVALASNTTVNIDTTAVAGVDAITINSANNAHGNANLNITTGGEAGDVIQVDGGATFSGTVDLSSQQINFNNLTSVVSATTVNLNAGIGAITDGSIGTPSVAATTLTAIAGTGISLGTNVGSLTANTTAAGAIVITEANAITLASVTTANGPISITAGGATTVTSVVSTTDADANDISISASAGDMTVTTVTAGAGAAADVTLQALAGSVLDDGIPGTIVTADVLSITALRDIGAPGAGAIDSTANSLVAATTGGPFAPAPVTGIWVNDTNSITVTSATTVDGVIILDCLTGTMTATVVNANGAGRNVRLRALDGDLIGSFIRSGGGSVTLNAEDNFSLLAGSLTQAATTVSLTSLDGVDAGGSTFNFAGDVDATLMTLTGLGEADTFNVRPDGDGGGPDLDTPISILGAAPVVAPGDVLNLDVTGLGVPTLLLGPGANNGIYSFAAAASVTYNSIETVNSGGGAVNVVLDMQFEGFQDVGADTDTIFVRLDAAGTNLLIDVDGVPVFQGADATINSLTIIGSDDDDVLRIDETAGGLPRFAGQTPAVNNTGVGGGIANPSHLNPSTDLVLETLFAAGTPWNASDVTIQFAGRTGADSIELNLITAHQTAYASDTLDGANSGNLGTAGGLGPDFLMSFANLAPLNLNGAGGQLLVDATSTPATSLLTLSDDGVVGDGWSQIAGNGGFETTGFRDYDQLFLVGGDGAELIDMVGLDSASSLLNVTIQGGNTADLLGLVGGDSGNDTIRVRSTLATTPVVVDADAGDDLVQLFDGANTVDNILANVNINGGSGNNTLTVVDSGDVSSDTVLITQNTIEGNTGFAGSPDVNYANIDTLNLTATAASDVIDAAFAPGSDLDTVNLSGWTGADQFYLSTTDEQIGGTATGIGVINLFGDFSGNPNDPDGNDIFGETPASLIPGTPQGLGVRMIRNSISTLINIDGGQPTAAPNPPVEDQVGDILNLDVSALLPPVIVATLGANNSLPGVAQSIAVPPSHQPVNFIQIEDINLVDGGILTDVEMGDLYIRGTNNADSVNFLATTDPLVPRVRVNAYQNYFRVTRRAVVYGRGGNDYIQMGNFNHPAEFYGEAGDDYLTGYLSSDKLVGGQGRDRINASHGNNVVWGDSDPVEVGLPDIEANRQLMASMSSGSRLDTLDADILSTLDGNDTMYGGPGPDSMTLGGGTDYAYGGQGNDSIALGAGDDRGYGGLGNDTITGSGGNDLINGGEGNDSVSGDQGLDVVIGGGGNDAVNGGDGNDLLFDGRVTYTGVSAESQTIGDANDVAMAALLADWATLVPGTLSGAFTNDRDGIDQVRGNAGADSFSADAADILDFELGIDTILP